ncbi:hypothetical protein N658DRAFT_431842, partial [Parathielavia hyrcaniae]
RTTGLSNFNIFKTKRVFEVAKIVPAVNQVEINPTVLWLRFFPQKDLHEFSARHGILLMAHQPLGGRPVGAVRAHPDEPFPTEDPTIIKVADECNVSPAQVCLSWAVQRGIPVVLKSVQEGHMRQNLDLKRLPDDLFDEINAVSSRRGAIRFLDPGRHIGFDIFDEVVDQPLGFQSHWLSVRYLHWIRQLEACSVCSEQLQAISALQVDFLPKRSFAGLLSRSGTEKSSHGDIARPDTPSTSLSVSVPSLDHDDDKGPLGLTTLYEPEPPTESLVDIVFIHGLGGGSRKTWSYSSRPHHYWPRSWLPADNDFLDVRIHTFGYKADWGERRDSILDIHDFAQSLLGALRNHPRIRRSSTRIILVGHSMGGCVAKKAYILARQDPIAADFAARVQSIFFLATPHRGSDMAAILENILAMAWGKKPYVTDLTPNSSALTAINDTFRHFAPELCLWSFYETLPTRSIVSRIVVDRHSATLGYHNEEIAGLDADHRHVCKFDTPADPNYKTFRNALLTAVDVIRGAVRTEHGARQPGDKESSPSTIYSKPRMSPAEVTSRLRSFLGIRKPVESDLASLQVLKQPGSCEWFTAKSCFASWRAGTAPGILWLAGRPAAGKSILSTHVIDQLSAAHVHCSYFICKHGKAGESTLGDCLRSLAFQMAMQDDLVQEAVLQLAEDDLAWDMTDEATLWRRLFTGCVFRTKSLAQHFWVIDGVDECVNFNALFAKRILMSLPKGLRLFATSRNMEAIERGLAPLIPNGVYVHALSDEDTAEDIRLFLATGLMDLGRPETLEDRERMCDKILQRSSGSFLWARLVLQEFEHAWTVEAMEAVLREIPRGLSNMYSRMVQSVAQDPRKLALATSILTWVALACRPLTVGELRCAVKVDINQTLQNPTKAIPDLCGQLVFIDRQNRIQVIHDTAREFLLSASFGLALSAETKQDHTRLASLLLRYLSSDVLKPSPSPSQRNPGHLKGFSKPAVAPSLLDTSLLDYACTFFSEHVCRSSPSDHQLMDDLVNFLQANSVLSWIEHIAKTGNLMPISRAAMNLREYLGRRLKYVPPTDKSMQLVDDWVTDLIRVAPKFRAALLDCPSSIHSLIPPLCPSESVISQTFGMETRLLPVPSRLSVEGIPRSSWDFCVARMDFSKGQATALRHGDRFFAVGLSTGQISLYDPISIQIIRSLDHPEPVELLEFGPNDSPLASCGGEWLAVWDPKSGDLQHKFALRSPPLAIVFLGLSELLGAFECCELIKWDLKTEEVESISWKDFGLAGDPEISGYPPVTSIVPAQPPSCASFLTTPDGVLLALGYRVHPILIWSALDLQVLGICKPDFINNGIDAMAFSPNPGIPALVVSFQDGSLCVFNYSTMELQVRLTNVYANAVACSADGRTVITGSSQGLIEVFELEQDYTCAAITLTTIYRTNHPLDETITGVGFSADGLRFVDIRGRQGRVWAPAALVRKGTSEREGSVRSSDADVALLFPPRPTHVVLEPLGSPGITSSLVPSSDGKLVVAGKSDGNVALFSAADAEEIGLLQQHGRGASIISVALVESRNWVISADGSRVLVAETDIPLSEISAASSLKNPTIVLDQRFDGAVTGVLANGAGDRILVSGHYNDELWILPSGEVYLAGSATAITDATLAVPTTSLPPCPFSHGVGPSTSTGEWRAASGPRCAFQYPTNKGWFVVVTRDIARVYTWNDFTELTSPEGIRLARKSFADPSRMPPSPTETSTSWEYATATYVVGPSFVVERFQPSRSASPRLYLWPAAELDPSSQSGAARPAIEPSLDAASPAVLQLLRLSGPSTLLFLDANLWICSVDLQSVTPIPPSVGLSRLVGFSKTRLSSESYPSRASSSQWSAQLSQSTPGQPTAHARRHFFALSEWRSGNGELRCAVSVNPPVPGRGASGPTDVVAFAAGSRLVVVHGGLGFSESVVAAGTVDGDAAVSDTAGQYGGGRGAGQELWKVVSGSMHRRSSNW